MRTITIIIKYICIFIIIILSILVDTFLMYESYSYLFIINRLYPINQSSASFAMSGHVSKRDALHRCINKVPKCIRWHSPSERISREQHGPNKATPEPSKRLSTYPHRMVIPPEDSVKENIPVRVAHRSYTLRRALSHNTTHQGQVPHFQHQIVPTKKRRRPNHM